jgi:hypothetical protein
VRLPQRAEAFNASPAPDRRNSPVAPTQDFGLLFVAEFICSIAEQLPPAFLKPQSALLPFVWFQFENRDFQLLQTHKAQFSKFAPAGECHFLSIWSQTNMRLNAIPMKITRQIAADKTADYLHGKLSPTELVDWAERAMMDAELVEADAEILSDIIGRLGLADVAEFGLRWQDCEEFLRRLGYRATVTVSHA